MISPMKYSKYLFLFCLLFAANIFFYNIAAACSTSVSVGGNTADSSSCSDSASLGYYTGASGSFYLSEGCVAPNNRMYAALCLIAEDLSVGECDVEFYQATGDNSVSVNCPVSRCGLMSFAMTGYTWNWDAVVSGSSDSNFVPDEPDDEPCPPGTVFNGSICVTDTSPPVFTCPGGTICGGTPVTGTPGQVVCGTNAFNYTCTANGWEQGSSCDCPIVPGYSEGYYPPGYSEGYYPPGYSEGYYPPGYSEGYYPPGYSEGYYPPGYSEGYYPPPAVPSGNISATSCTIPGDASTCDSFVTWNTDNLISGVSTEVTRNNPRNTHVSYSTSGINVRNIVKYGASSFFLYHNGAEPPLDSANINASCSAGTIWDGNKCKITEGSLSGTIIPASSFCNIPVGQNSCTINFSWNTLNPPEDSVSAITRAPANTVVASGYSGTSVPLVVKYDIETFYLYNSGRELARSTVTSRCTSGTTWNGVNQCVVIVGNVCQDETANNTGSPLPCTSNGNC